MLRLSKLEKAMALCSSLHREDEGVKKNRDGEKTGKKEDLEEDAAMMKVPCPKEVITMKVPCLKEDTMNMDPCQFMKKKHPSPSLITEEVQDSI